jgi:mono/diheme cytochrome c family protein
MKVGFNEGRERLLSLFLPLFFLACTSSAPSSAEEELIKRGQTTYITQCASCHNADPKKEGVLGPAVFGSSKQLLEARVLNGIYPAGYSPKRQTQVMQALPHLKNEMDALTSFLNQKK